MKMTTLVFGNLREPTDTQTLSSHLRSFKHSFLNLLNVLKPSAHTCPSVLVPSVLTHGLQFVHTPALAHSTHTTAAFTQAQVVPQVAPDNAQVTPKKVSTWKMKGAVILLAVLSFTVFTTVTADPAAAAAQTAPQPSGEIIQGALDKFLESKIGEILQSLAQAFAIFLVFATLTFQVYKVYKTGAGFSSALPTIIGAMAVAGVLLNIKLLGTAITGVTAVVAAVFASVGDLLP